MGSLNSKQKAEQKNIIYQKKQINFTQLFQFSNQYSYNYINFSCYYFKKVLKHFSIEPEVIAIQNQTDLKNFSQQFSDFVINQQFHQTFIIEIQFGKNQINSSQLINFIKELIQIKAQISTLIIDTPFNYINSTGLNYLLNNLSLISKQIKTIKINFQFNSLGEDSFNQISYIATENIKNVDLNLRGNQIGIKGLKNLGIFIHHFPKDLKLLSLNLGINNIHLADDLSLTENFILLPKKLHSFAIYLNCISFEKTSLESLQNLQLTNFIQLRQLQINLQKCQLRNVGFKYICQNFQHLCRELTVLKLDLKENEIFYDMEVAQYFLSQLKYLPYSLDILEIKLRYNYISLEPQLLFDYLLKCSNQVLFNVKVLEIDLIENMINEYNYKKLLHKYTNVYWIQVKCSQILKSLGL